MNKEKIIIILLLILLAWFGSAIVRLENYHYASQISLCDEFLGLDNLIKKDNCFDEKETRTNPFWHLLYGLKII
jgi:hypothetical protein